MTGPSRSTVADKVLGACWVMVAEVRNGIRAARPAGSKGMAEVQGDRGSSIEYELAGNRRQFVP
jgi:hypothetical protein